jgi:hypothetical protein
MKKTIDIGDEKDEVELGAFYVKSLTRLNSILQILINPSLSGIINPLVA